MKRFLVWFFTDALSVEVDGAKYVPDWNAIGAVAGAAAAAIGLLAIWYSIFALRRQLRHQSELEAKQLEQQLLVHVMELAQTPYEASKAHVADVMTWRESSGPTRSPEFLSQAAMKATDGHRLLSTATASALSVLRRSRPRRFPKGTRDRALEQYDDLIQKTLEANGAMLKYGAGAYSMFSLESFQSQVGSEAFQFSNLLRRVTGEMLARMYSDDPEWVPLQFRRLVDESGAKLAAFDFVDDPPLGRRN